jgi:alpha-ketoglutarate-dependent taurine dioxygenase
MKETILSNGYTSLPILEIPDWDATEFISWFKANRGEMEEKLDVHGALKFSGVRIRDLETFRQIVESISERFLNYIDGNSPRTKLSGTVYTSTEYDKSARITMHNELSYSAIWPGKLFFSCLQPSDTGGETLLADSRSILQRMNKEIVENIAQRGVTYIRNLHSGRGIGPSWQDTFETDDRNRLEEYCRSYGIRFEWRKGDHLRLVQASKGIIQHRKSKVSAWFNQIDQFHPSHLDEEVYEGLLALYDSPSDFPIFVTFGDGRDIDEETVAEILRTTEEVTLSPVWQVDELLIVDNELVSHGRNSYTGDRKVLVSMSE